MSQPARTAARPTRDASADAQATILARLYMGRGKLYHWPNGQWSRGGNKYLRPGRNAAIHRLLADQRIVRIGERNDRPGVHIYDISEAGVAWLHRFWANQDYEPE